MTVSILPLFEQCSKYTLDLFWIEIFQNCSNDKFPKGVRYNKNDHSISIPSKKKNSNETIILPKESIELYKVFKNILQTKLFIQSDVDKFNCKSFEKAEDFSNKWKDIKTKYQKDLAICNYVSKVSNLRGITKKNARKLLSIINIGIQYKTINPGDIIVENGEIVSIKNLLYNKTNKKIKLDTTKMHAKLDVNVKKDYKPCGVKQNKFEQLLDKFIKEYITSNDIVFESRDFPSEDIVQPDTTICDVDTD